MVVGTVGGVVGIVEWLLEQLRDCWNSRVVV